MNDEPTEIILDERLERFIKQCLATAFIPVPDIL
jgi:hypothetical protein